jgi:hypothetical protein
MVEEKKEYLLFSCPQCSETISWPFTKHEIETALNTGEAKVFCNNNKGCDVVKVPFLDPQIRVNLKKRLDNWDD